MRTMIAIGCAFLMLFVTACTCEQAGEQSSQKVVYKQ